MIDSLDRNSPDGTLEADVIVVGAGLAGLFLADQLRDRGLRVLILESGDEKQEGTTHPLNQVEFKGRRYEGATYGRFRGLGGTSAYWGGALLPYLSNDLAAHPCGWHNGWGIPAEELTRYLPIIETTFGLTPGSYDGDQELASSLPNFIPRLPKFPKFQRRNTAHLFNGLIKNDPDLRIWTGSTVTKIEFRDGRVEGVIAKSLKGDHLVAKAPHVVLAAGAIETTRLLLLLDLAYNRKIFPKTSMLGAQFHDHLSAAIADFVAVDFRKITRLFGFRFVSGGVRNLRFELEPAARVRLGLPAAFLHVAFSRPPNGAFVGLRNVFQAVQKRQLPNFSDVVQIFRDLPWLLRAGWWRTVEKRLFPPTLTKYQLHLVTEQEPLPSQRISLSSERQDSFGLPLACIEWNVSNEDVERFKRIARIATDSWRAGAFKHSAEIRPLSDDIVDAHLHGLGGIYHPAGTTRLGPDPKKDVVDANLRVHGVPGLRVLATSIFPSIGGSSPSLTLLLLACRMAEEISNEKKCRYLEQISVTAVNG